MSTQSVLPNRQTGHNIEAAVSQYLQSQAVKIVDQNFYCKMGEIDLIGLYQHNLLFIEVRYRKNKQYGTPFETIGPSKRKRIIKTAQFYLQKHRWTAKYPSRFDVVSVSGTIDQLAVEWIPDAFRVE